MPPASPVIATTLPAAYGDGAFDVLLRSADSVAVFWDLPETEETDHCADSRLCLRLTDQTVPESRVEILNGLCGHRILAVENAAPELGVELGWMDPQGRFERLGQREIHLPARLT